MNFADKNVIHSFKGDAHLKFQEHLLPELDKLLKKNSITLSDIGSFCVVVGPGSFTGVRLGVTMVKAFSYVDKTKKIISINMLELLMDKISKTITGDFLVVIKCTTSKMYVGESVQGKYSFKVLTNEEVAQMATKTDDPLTLAYNIRNLAFALGSQDNISVIARSLL